MHFQSFGPYNTPLLFIFRRKYHVGGAMKWTMTHIRPDEHFGMAAAAVLDEHAVLYRLAERHTCTIRFGDGAAGELVLEIRQPKLTSSSRTNDDPPPPPPSQQICNCEGGSLRCDVNATPDCNPLNQICLPTHGDPGGRGPGNERPADDGEEKEQAGA